MTWKNFILHIAHSQLPMKLKMNCVNCRYHWHWRILNCILHIHFILHIKYTWHITHHVYISNVFSTSSVELLQRRFNSNSLAFVTPAEHDAKIAKVEHVPLIGNMKRTCNMQYEILKRQFPWKATVWIDDSSHLRISAQPHDFAIRPSASRVPGSNIPDLSFCYTKNEPGIYVCIYRIYINDDVSW